MKAICFKHTLLTLFLATAIAGCGSLPQLDEVVPDNTKKYRKAETMPPLDLPPDLSTDLINDQIAASANSSATYSEFEEASTNPLASKYNITPDTKPSLAGEGSNRHLIVPGDRDVTWQRLNNFWAQKGYAVKRQDERIGLMDTDVGVDGYPFRIRMERGEINKQARVYVSGRGEEVNPQRDETMLRQIADFLGVLHQEDQAVKAQHATQPTQSAIKVVLVDDADGQQTLLVKQEYSSAWKRVGRVLDSKGFTVEDRDQSLGTYFVRYIDPFHEIEKEEEGWLDKISFWKDEVEKTPEEFYYIKLISDADQTRVMILDYEEVRTSSDTAKRLLGLIHEQLSP